MTTDGTDKPEWPPHPLEYATALRVAERIWAFYADGNDDDAVLELIHFRRLGRIAEEADRASAAGRKP